MLTKKLVGLFNNIVSSVCCFFSSSVDCGPANCLHQWLKINFMKYWPTDYLSQILTGQNTRFTDR